jgi:DNA polymerase-3 subunit beta
MILDIDKRDLLNGLTFVQNIAGRKTTLPILSHVLMEADRDSLYLTGTDLETGIREGLSANVQQEGRASVSAKKLYEIVKELPDEMIHMEKKENHWITLKCGKSTFNLAGLDPDEFPSLPTYREENFSKVPKAILMDMIQKTVFAASNEESRYHLNGIFLLQTKQAGKEVLKMVATDGHRLSLIHREGYRIRGIEKGIILPKKGVMEARKIMGEKADEQMEIYFDGTHGFLRMGKSLMILRLIDGEFPEYEQVIPKENDKRVRMEKEKIQACLKRISTMASERVEGIKVALTKNAMEATSFNQDFGDAREEVDVVYEGTPIEVAFNARYLLDVLREVDTSEVWMELKDEGSPAILKPLFPEASAGSSDKSTHFIGSNDQLFIIMPMRI